jgi:predicted nucleic acid-binding protein
VDTGPFVALFDKDDQHHDLCKKTLKEIKEPLITNCAVLTETMYLLSFSLKAQELFLDYLQMAGIVLHNIHFEFIPRIRQLLHKYDDLPIDFTDASLVALAEAENIKTIFTLDHRHFSVYSPKHVGRFCLIPNVSKKQNR